MLGGNESKILVQHQLWEGKCGLNKNAFNLNMLSCVKNQMIVVLVKMIICGILMCYCECNNVCKIDKYY